MKSRQAELNEAKPRPQAKQKEGRWKEEREEGGKGRKREGRKSRTTQPSQVTPMEAKDTRQDQAYIQGTELRRTVTSMKRLANCESFGPGDTAAKTGSSNSRSSS